MDYTGLHTITAKDYIQLQLVTISLIMFSRYNFSLRDRSRHLKGPFEGKWDEEAELAFWGVAGCRWQVRRGSGIRGKQRWGTCRQKKSKL